MANIKVEINLFPKNTNGYIDYDLSDFGKLNNISDYRELNKTTINSNPYILGSSGALGLGINYFYSNIFKGIMTKARCNSNGIFETPYQITLRGNEINFFRISFDINVGQYAKKLRIDGVLIDNDSFTILHELTTEKNEILIEIIEWSKPNSQVVINAISMEIQQSFNKSQIKDLLIGSQLTNDDTKPSFSVIGQYGNFNLMDKDNLIYDYLKSDMITNDTVVKVYFNNVLIGTFTETEWTKNSDKSSYYIELKDGTTVFGTTIIPISVFHYENIQPISMLQLFNDVFAYVDLDTFKMSDEIRNKFESIILNRVFFSKNDDLSLLSILNKICNATQTIMLINADNELEVLDYV